MVNHYLLLSSLSVGGVFKFSSDGLVYMVVRVVPHWVYYKQLFWGRPSGSLSKQNISLADSIVIFLRNEKEVNNG